MRPWLSERVLPTLALFGIGGIVPGASLHFFGGTHVDFGGNVHFVGVGVSAVAAAVAAVALTAVGSARRDARAVLVGTAFTAMASLLAIHGLATPGILIGYNGVIAFTGAATLPIGGALLALSTLPAARRPEAIRPLLVLQGAGLVSVILLGTLGMAFPSLVPAVPEPRSPVAWGGLLVGTAFFALLATRAFKTYRLTRRTADLLVVIGILWLTAALPAALLLDYSELGWWLGHCFELFGIVLVGAAVAGDLRRSSQSRPLAGDLRAPDLVAAEEAFLGGRVRSLTRLLGEKDTSTEEHTRRVALRAVQVGEELGLTPGRLRSLAIGGLLHDIGKLSIPEAILKKPAPLDDAEYAVIRKHPESGDRLLRELGGFADSVRALVRDHHERLDGCGYPRGLAADELDLDTRILTVCDVYDALISARVYRDAWTHEQALELLRKETGGAFDSRCVDALVRVLERERERDEPTIIPAARAAYA
jgi:hypothetical protein